MRVLLAWLGFAALAAVADAASITAFTPTQGSLMGGTLLTVTGSGFLRDGAPVRGNWSHLQLPLLVRFETRHVLLTHPVVYLSWCWPELDCLSLRPG